MITQSSISTAFEIDEFTNIGEIAGRNFNNLPYDVRVLFHQNLTSDELRQLKTNNLSPEVSIKAQKIIDAYYTEMNPTPDELLQRKMEEWRDTQIADLGDLIYRDSNQLNQLDAMVENDEVIPAGARKKLREQIQQNKDALTKLGVNPDAVIERTNFLKSDYRVQHELKTTSPNEYHRIMNLEVRPQVSDKVHDVITDLGFDADSFMDGSDANGKS